MDNSTVWRPDFNQAYFQDLYFGGGESLQNYYETQSSGRYSVERHGHRLGEGAATTRPATAGPTASRAARIVCTNTWELVRDAANQWVADQLAAGRTPAQVKAELQTFDEWDRYDFDGDGNFNEPDGYIDHFQIVHAGGDQADGDPIYGEDAIWSHRWYAFVSDAGVDGPPSNPLGGTQIGNTGIWIGDYTIQPENGGRSVFYHEYGHDLGLPDDYNILSGGDNNNEHWTLMAQSRLGAKNDGGIGERGGDLGAWNKLQLGWLDYETVDARPDASTVDARPAGVQLRQAAGARGRTCRKKAVTTDLGCTGRRARSSGTAATATTSTTRSAATVTLPAGAGVADASRPATTSRTAVRTRAVTTPTSRSTTARGSTADPGHRSPTPPRATASTALSAGVRAGDVRPVGVRRADDRPAVHATSPTAAVAGNGAALRRRHLRRRHRRHRPGLHRRRRDRTPAGRSNGFSAVGATRHRPSTTTTTSPAHRSYVSYDQYLKTGPYYFGYLNTRPDFVDHYAYQQGLLISYWDTSYADNDTFAHPGIGRNLYIDAHPEPMTASDGGPGGPGSRSTTRRSGCSRTDRVQLHHNSALETISQQVGPAALRRHQDSTGTRSCPTTASSCPPWASRSVVICGHSAPP